MQDPKEALQTALKDAMKNKANLRRDVIRMSQNAIKQIEIDSQKTLNSEEVMDILQKEAKKRRDTIEELIKTGRTENLGQEQQELSILEEFLPKQLTRDEITVLVKEAIAKTGASSLNDMGRLMGALMPKVKGVADGKLVNQIVRELLS